MIKPGNIYGVPAIACLVPILESLPGDQKRSQDVYIITKIRRISSVTVV